MNFDFSEDAKAIREHAREFLRERVPPGAVRHHIDGGATHDVALWAEFASMGWLGVAIPEQFGGSGLGYEAAAVLAEEIGAVAAPVPFASTVYLASEALLRFGNADQQRRYLPGIAAGERIGCFALSEGEGEPTNARVRGRVTDGKLTGEKIPVTDGEAAHFAIVVALDADEPQLFIADLEHPTVERVALRTLDAARPQAELRFAGTPVEVLGDGPGWPGVEALLDRAAVLLAFEQVGGAQAALDMAVAFARDRYAFGRPIGSFQAIKHKLADIYVAVEIARSNAYYAAWALERDAAELPLAAATARSAAIDAFDLASKENIQTHGGMGFTWESDCHIYYTRAKSLGLLIGGARHWKNRLLRILETRNEAA
ncbi:acyl-CoA dehydrogenase family protein [Terricaulis silvestris]|uniref:Acyl-CoA dehydrogenase n=1 Tax=Terricaulis silvestris TaxID=2686094 RepID=A0A6I6MKE4_9CAUL|nr:acyl-CoA dehydrogenase family protein [Terricaulis silvestris]QGZ93688.1 Acyl-CoA dehydrogenase [Terricaulis silvestris]